MVSINANTQTRVSQFLSEFEFYLFVFTDGCTEYKYNFEPIEQTNCGNWRLFEVLVDIPMGTYDLKIYGNTNGENENYSNLDLLHSEEAKVYNPENICFDMPYLLDENGYPLLDENNINILQ